MDKIKVFEDYLFGNLPKTEREAFEKSLAENEDLKRKFFAYRLANEGLESHVSSELKSLMQDWRIEGDAEEDSETGEKEARLISMHDKSKEGTPRTKKPSTFPFRALLKIAAGLAVIITAWFLIQNDSGPEYLSNYTGIIDSPVRGMQVEENLKKAEYFEVYQDYMDDEFLQAIERADKVSEERDGYRDAQLLKGICLERVDRADEAISTLENLLILESGTDRNLFFQKVKWVLANYKLKHQGINEENKEYLAQLIADPNFIYREQAITLQKQLD